MNRGRDIRSTGLRILLVALAVQAVTPDARDLASPWLFRSLARAVALRPTVGEAGPGAGRLVADRGGPVFPLREAVVGRGRKGPGESPDEVCTPPQPAGGRLVRRSGGVSPDLPPRPASLSARLADPGRPGRPPTPPPLGPAAAGVVLIRAVCRMTC